MGVCAVLMERVHKLHEVRPSLSQITHTEFHHGHSRRYLRCFVACFVSLFFLLMLYVPAYHQTRTRDDQMHIVNIPGWSLNTSRDLKLYVLPENLTAIIPQPDICSEKLFLLIVVCSAVGNFEARSAIRQTWASAPVVTEKASAIRVAFLLGESENNTLQEQVEEESIKHSDIIQEGFLDTYNNLTLKSVMLLKWTVTNCPSVRYIMKTDDDMFVNIESLVRLLRSKGSTGLLIGALICGAHPISDSHSKWYAPRYMYPGRVYPNYLSGTGYVMSNDVMKRLYKAALQTPLFHLEDVYVTGLCSKAAGIRPRDHPAFTYARRRIDPCLLRDRSVITSHRMDSAQLLKIWPRIRDPNLDCSSFTVSQKPSSRPNKKTAKVRRPVNKCV
ncbi:beta-1,3-galactosyltransferase 1-like isoform X1 [Schistocerca nitens]|uniref:beta-1,3-galactosyltransferase 1-like isoform X1 n=1 Tax=Schistocerca nitens TaxID=7011 RepID=UPI00211732F2|nr:beta-1,3-galactosyltransferase 1-like isoform X1 [Schistocerca nitens]